MDRIEGKHILITGGTGSLGTALVNRLLSEYEPKAITVFSRDELKQHEMRHTVPDERLHFMIGDVRDYRAILSALKHADIVFHTAAMKHVPSCQENPCEAVLTNIDGTINIIRAINEFNLNVDTVIGVSSDKGVHPVNTYGATKFIQEQLLLHGNIDCPTTRFICVCYGNVMASRGSVIPLFNKQIQAGGPVTVTNGRMTRFLISLDQAVDTLLTALEEAQRGEVYIPIIPAAYLGDIAQVLIGNSGVKMQVMGKRCGEKMHEVLITQEESERVVRRGDYYVVTEHAQDNPALYKEYVSHDYVIELDELDKLLRHNGLLLDEGVVA